MTPGQPLHLSSSGLAPRVGPPGRVLHVEGETLYVGRGLDLLRSRDGGAHFELIGRAPGGPVARRLAAKEYSSRLLRTGFHGLAPLPDGGLLAIVRGAILFQGPSDARFSVAQRVRRGSRPLNLCVLPSGHAYYGEYFSNPERDQVHIYGSVTGREWEVVGSFPAGTVRHVHGVHHDPHRGGMWVLTGDEDHEAGLWWTGDEFQTLEPVWRGTQSVRAVTLFAESWGLIVPTDTPFETNWVQHLDPESGAVTRLAPLPGSVFHSARSEHLWLLSTVVERSSVNTDPRPALFASADGLDWSPVAQLERDRPPFARERSIFQWPTLVLPTGRSTGDALYGSGQALAGAHGRLLEWSERALLERISKGRELRSA